MPEATWAHCNGIKSLCNGAKETWYFNARLGQVWKKTVALGKMSKVLGETWLGTWGNQNGEMGSNSLRKDGIMGQMGHNSPQPTWFPHAIHGSMVAQGK